MTDETAGASPAADAEAEPETPVVVKIGGAAAVDPQGTLTDVAHLHANGVPVVVVHGGSTAVDDLLADLDRSPEYVQTPGGVVGRFTDEATMDAVTMAMSKVNADLVCGLQNAGVNAVGLSGVDGQLLAGPRKSAVKVTEDGKKKIKRGDHSGTIESVNADLLWTLLDAGHVPVVSVPMLGVESGADGTATGSGSGQADPYTAVNSDADHAAAAVAGALGADLVLLTDVAGVYADPDDESTLLEAVVNPADLDAVEAAAEGFMTRKVMAAVEALEDGATSVTIGDANAADPLLSAVGGAGTVFSPGALGADAAEGTPGESATGYDTDAEAQG